VYRCLNIIYDTVIISWGQGYNVFFNNNEFVWSCRYTMYVISKTISMHY